MLLTDDGADVSNLVCGAVEGRELLHCSTANRVLCAKVQLCKVLARNNGGLIRHSTIFFFCATTLKLRWWLSGVNLAFATADETVHSCAFPGLVKT